MKCKRQGCHNPSARAPQVYCSRECAPYGHFSQPYKETDHRRERRLQKKEETIKRMKELSAEGKTRQEAAADLGLSPITLKVYSKRWKIPFKTPPRKRPSTKKVDV